MATEKTIYLCNGSRLGVHVTDACKASSASLSLDSNGHGTIALVPRLLAPVQIDIKLLKEGDDVNAVQPVIDWEMVADSIDGDPPYWTSGVRITGTIPQACDWRESRIKSSFNAFPVLAQNPLPREIPDSKELALASDSISTVTTYLVPGEYIWAEHEYSLTAGNGAARIYWRTIAMMGGVIIDKWMEPTEDLYKYDVEAEGTIYNDILPTDYYRYEVGDWVFVLTLTPVATIRDREVLTPDPPDLDDQLRIAPFSIAGHGQYPNIKSYGGDSDFAEWGNMRILYGIIQSIVGDVPPDDHRTKTNYATVELAQDGSIITNVPIKYWCQEDSTDKSCHAFDPGDVVLVSFDGYRETPSSFNCTIIGHAAGVYPCTTTTTTTTQHTTTSTTSSSTTSSTTSTTGTFPPASTTTTTTTAYPSSIYMPPYDVLLGAVQVNADEERTYIATCDDSGQSPLYPIMLGSMVDGKYYMLGDPVTYYADPYQYGYYWKFIGYWSPSVTEGGVTRYYCTWKRRTLRWLPPPP